jgi:hypothetical protein
MEVGHRGQPENSSMNCRAFAFVMLGLFMHVAAPTQVARAADEPGGKRADLVHLSGTRSPEELAARIAQLLSTSTRSDLDRLASAPDCTAAIAAGWERVRRTMPSTELEDVVPPDLLAITRFLGLIEGRLQVPIPKTWEETVKSATGHGQKNIWFPPRPDLALAARRGERWPLERDGAHWLLKNERRLIKLPAEAGLGLVSNATAECAGESVYVAVYGSLSDAYRLFALHQDNGQIMWSSKVWGPSKVWPRGVIVNISGSDWHVVTMRASDEMLTVFGFSGRAVYVEAFDRKTGENRCRFSTAYFAFDAAPPR